MNRRGSSNIEMVLAFVLFIGALLFVIYFLSSKNVDYSPDLEQFQKEVFEIVSSEAVKKALFFDSLDLVIAVELGEKGGVRVETADGVILDSEREGDLVYISRSAISQAYVNVGEAYSNSYNGGISSRPSENKNKYKWGSSISSSVIDEDKILKLNQSYFESPEKVRETFNLAVGEQYSIEFKFNETEFIKIGDNFQQGNIFTKTLRSEIVRTSGDSVFAEVKITLWE